MSTEMNMEDQRERSRSSTRVADRRLHLRRGLSSPTCVRLNGDTGATAVNLGEGGLGVRSSSVSVEESLSSVSFQLPRSGKWIQLTGKIVWIGRSQEEAGIEFVDLPETARIEISEWVSAEPSEAEFPEKLASVAEYTWLFWVVICWGAALRLTQYLWANRSLPQDEASLALNLVHRSFSQLLKPLDYGQGAPIGFLVLERAAVQVFGTGEYALRLFPLLCGLLSLFLFYRMAKLFVSPKSVPIALGLFAISGPLIYYSSAVKQYSSDVAIALLILYAAIYYESHRLTVGRVAVFGLLGALSVWLSHPSVFVLAGVGICLASFCLSERRWARMRTLAIVYSFWALSFAACYLISLRNLGHNEGLLSYWSFGFVPSPLLSLVTFEWFIRTFFGIFWNPIGLELAGIAALAFLVGCYSMSLNDRKKLLILLSPAIVTLLAAGIHKYPFQGRLLLFIVPSFLLLIAEGAELMRAKTKEGAPVIGACVIGLLFLHPVLFSTYHFIKPSAGELPPGIPETREEIKPVMKYVSQHERPGDVLFVYRGAIPAFRYYAPSFSFDGVSLVEGAGGEGQNYDLQDIQRIDGHKRVWLLFAHTQPGDNIDEEKLFLLLLDPKARRLDSLKSEGAAVYLYDLDGLN